MTPVGAGVQASEQQIESCAGGQGASPEVGQAHHLGKHPLGSGVIAQAVQRHAELPEQLRVDRLVPGGERSRAAEEVGRGGQVDPSGGPACRGRQPLGRPARQFLFAHSRRRKLHAILVGALKVIGEDLLVLLDPVAGGALQPVREALVELNPELLGIAW